jgi:rod shape-determining protein MreC
MESVLGRYRNLIILVGVLFLQVLGLAVQVKRGATTTGENTRLIRVWVVGAITPFERGLIWVENGGGNLWHNYFYLRGVRAENRELKSQIEQMRIEQVRLTEDAAQARRLQSLLAFKEQYIQKTVAAQVIGTSGSDLSRIISIDKGEHDGLKRDMAVITADGIVGKVLLVYPSVAQVLLISDQSSGVGAILEKSRLQGVLRGTPNGEVVLERVMSDEQVPEGETVLTSGGDQIFPKGLAVGTVTKVGNGKDLFLNIKVRPAADLSKLEEVLVLVEKQERQAVADDSTTREKAADILAARLPGVPDKPADANAAAANSAAANSGAEGAAGAEKPAVTPKITSASAAVHTSAATPSSTQTTKAVTPAAAAPKAAANAAGTGAPANSATTKSEVPKPVIPKPATPQIKPAAQTAKPPSIVPAQPSPSTPQPTGNDANPH